MFNVLFSGLYDILVFTFKLAILAVIAAVIIRFALFVVRRLKKSLTPAYEKTKKMFTNNGK